MLDQDDAAIIEFSKECGRDEAGLQEMVKRFGQREE
jgi:hypothetical protein